MRIWLRLLFMALVTVLVAAAFWVGFELGQARMSAMLQPQLAELDDKNRSGQRALSDALAEIAHLRQEGVVAERSLQIEREAAGSLQEQLKQAQDQRLELLKESKYLKRLVGDGGQGAVRVHDLLLTPGDGPEEYRYGFTVTQLVPGVGETSGRVLLALEGEQNGEVVSVPLDELPDASPTALAMNFEFFQKFDGVFALPGGFEPRGLSITIEPESKDLLRTSEVFPWLVAVPDAHPGGVKGPKRSDGGS